MLASSWFSSEVGLKQGVKTDSHHFKAVGLLASYVDAVRAVFPRGTEHEVSDGIYEFVNNNRSERFKAPFVSVSRPNADTRRERRRREYLDGWAIDYNFFKDHHALKGKTPAQVAGVAEQVPWTEWEDITRLGGEVAEVEVKEHTPVRKKPGPKPKITSVMEAVRMHLGGRLRKPTPDGKPSGHQR